MNYGSDRRRCHASERRAAAARAVLAALADSTLLDTPAPSEDVPACVASHLGNTGACAIPRDGASPKGRHEAMDAALRGRSITTLDPFDMFCGVDASPPIVGTVLVYRDESHMSASHARFLAPATATLFVPRT